MNGYLVVPLALTLLPQARIVSQIALFPLNMALFPGVTLPLRIFEQRYLRLVSETLKADSGFGVALIRSGREAGPASVWPLGLYVRIVDWSQGEEGLLHVKVRGERRFRIVRTFCDEDDLQHGEIEWLDEGPPHPVPAHYDGLISILNELKQHSALLGLEFAPVESAEALSWQLAQLLPLDDQVRIQLLETEDALQRLMTIAHSLERWTRD